MPASSLKAHNAQELSSPAKQSVVGKAESPKPFERSMMELSGMQQVLGNQALQRMLQPALQRACDECEDLRMSDSESAPPPTFISSLPIRLKSGVEALSGIAMDSVKVHYNSPEPAQVQALAYTQGTDIHVAPGQEQHLPHEAWHVVQQQQGRVRPTMQLAGTAINDDTSLESEADSMGAWALREGGSGAPHQFTPQAGSTTVQRWALTKEHSDNLETPSQIIKNKLGIAAVNQNLPGSKPGGQLERAKEVKAVITAKTLRTDDRGKSSNLEKITAMARAEEMILQGADMKGYYDAGHLVADQLIDGDPNKSGDGSFELWNLAPQATEFNAPTYATIFENEVRNAVLAPSPTATAVPTPPAPAMAAPIPSMPQTAKKRKLNTSSAASDVEAHLTVQVSYPADYNVTPEQLIRNRVIRADQVKPKDQLTPLTIPRRIPNQWTAKAELKNAPGIVAAQPEFPAIEKEAAPGHVAANFRTAVASADPTIADAFFFTLNDAKLQQDKLKIDKASTRTLEAQQWAPAAGGVREEDVISHTAKTFPALSTEKEIIEKLAPGTLSENEILTSLMNATVEAMKINDPGLSNEILTLSTQVQTSLTQSKDPNNSGKRSTYLDFADKAVKEMRTKIDKFIQLQASKAAGPLGILPSLPGMITVQPVPMNTTTT